MNVPQRLAFAAAVGLGCARTTVGLTPRPVIEDMAQFAIFPPAGPAMAGTAIIRIEPGHTELLALTPGGTQLFRVRQDGEEDPTIEAPDPRIAEALARLPLMRDVKLAYAWRCASPRCSTPTGTVYATPSSDGVDLRWKGKGGPATAVISSGTAEVRDLRRRYRVVFSGPGVQP